MSAELSRREFLKVIGRAALASAAVATGLANLSCEPQVSNKRVLSSEIVTRGPWRSGDVATIGKDAYLLRPEGAYPIPALELDRYQSVSEMEPYKRKMVSANSDLFKYFPSLQPEYPDSLSIIDPIGQLRHRRRYGGVVNVYIAGVGKDNVLASVVHPEEDTYVDIRTESRKNDWDNLSETFFTWGKDGLDNYGVEDTLKDPRINIAYALGKYMPAIRRTWLYAQVNIIGFSLGGIIALEIARQNMDMVNNLILINSPIQGIEKTDDRVKMLNDGKVLATPFAPFVWREKVSSYLFELWEDAEYRDSLKTFAKYFTSLGRRLVNVWTEIEDDLVFSQGSCVLEGASKEIILQFEKINIKDWIAVHGMALRDRQVIKLITESLGSNLALAA